MTAKACKDSKGVQRSKSVKACKGQGGWFDEPIATSKPTDEGWEVYKGRAEWLDESIATAEGSGRMDDGCVALYSLLV